MSDPIEENLQFKAPLVLIGISLFLLAGGMFFWGGNSVFIGGAFVILVGTLIDVVLSLGACFLTAHLMHVSFGNVGNAIVKLTAIILFPLAAAFAFTLISPIGDLFLLTVLWFSLLYVFFDLDGWKPLIFTFVLWGIRTLVEEVIVKAIA